MRIAEPQPPLYEDFAKPIYELPNAILVSNPALVNIHSSKDFSGFNVLLYHGYSFDFFVSNVDSIRNQGGYNRADLIMKFLLQRRHLAPTHTSIQFIPDVKEDFLVIDLIPDFFISGHIHRVSVLNYRNITLLGCGCWSDESEDQRKRGIVPEPGKVILVNLRNRNAKILNFRE